ncbi:glycosyltransferase family 4 protein [Tianweitania sp.]|uniref:glycosyltransferase family 4 protein n=1 Tax=Tianweitania sp. TaxID=2021634 RepID=UPI002897E334|nr:glycosyltransferase family 4 protein [Tianweitania sp.]
MRNAAADRALKVLVATPAGTTGRGGIDRIMAALRSELARRSTGVIAQFLPTRGNGSLALSWLHLTRFCLQMAGARVRGDVDLLHINLASRGSTYRKIVLAACARILRIPYVIHLHGAEYREFWANSSQTVSRRIHGMFAHASRIIVLGMPWRAFVAQMVPEAAARIVIVPNAVAEAEMPGNAGGASVHILFMGRIEERKGVPELVRALTSLRDMPGWHATIAGDGGVEALRAEVAEFGLQDRIAVPGWLGAQDAARLLATGDILTLPSHAENLPMSVIEAMAAGLAVVATPVGAVEDIIEDGETGLLVPPGNADALADALALLVRDTALRQRLAAAGQRFQRAHLSISPYADRIVSVWHDAVAEHLGKTAREDRRGPL